MILFQFNTLKCCGFLWPMHCIFISVQSVTHTRNTTTYNGLIITKKFEDKDQFSSI